MSSVNDTLDRSSQLETEHKDYIWYMGRKMKSIWQISTGDIDHTNGTLLVGRNRLTKHDTGICA